ncbi:MAG: cystathionine beta-synthase [Candidatus Glassbacteria bacterium]
MKYYNSILEVIGNTPLIRLPRIAKDVKAMVLCKAEFLNPGGSVKDRIGMSMVEDAERRGLLNPGGTIIESTSGNTGVGLALVAATKGYRAVFTMPDKMSGEKIRLLKAFGAEVVITPTAVPPESPESYYEVAKRLSEERSNSIYVNQYFNEHNTLSHYQTTGPEIWDQTEGRITHLVAGMGTGGTISGVGKYLKEQNDSVRVIGVDPDGSILKDRFYNNPTTGARPYKVEGIGEDLIPGTLHFEYIDEVHTVTDKESFHWARRLAREEGILVGGSSGSALAVTMKISKDLPEDAVVVVIFPDCGERYLSKCHSDEWMKENNMIGFEGLTAGEILTFKSSAIAGVISVSPEDRVHTALKLMNEHGFSYIPVIDDNASIGTLAEQEVGIKVMQNTSLLEAKVTELMGSPLPEVTYDTGVAGVARALAKNKKAILVKKDGEIIGIITIYDLLGYYGQ